MCLSLKALSAIGTLISPFAIHVFVILSYYSSMQTETKWLMVKHNICCNHTEHKTNTDTKVIDMTMLGGLSGLLRKVNDGTDRYSLHRALLVKCCSRGLHVILSPSACSQLIDQTVSGDIKQPLHTAASVPPAWTQTINRMK